MVFAIAKTILILATFWESDEADFKHCRSVKHGGMTIGSDA